jgi:hypothetical protein
VATKTPPAPVADSQEEWETVSTGLGREWDMQQDGPVVGLFVEMKTLQVEDKQNGGMRDSNAYLLDVDGDPRFIWGSYEIDQAFQTGFNNGNPIPAGTKVRVSYIGLSNFTGDKGPQTVKNFKVQIAKQN